MLCLTTADCKIRRLNVTMNITFCMNKLNSINKLKANHKNSLKRKAPSSSLPQTLHIIPKLIKDNIFKILLLHNILKLRKPPQSCIFQHTVKQVQLILKIFVLLFWESFHNENLLLALSSWDSLYSQDGLLLRLFQNVSYLVAVVDHLMWWVLNE